MTKKLNEVKLGKAKLAKTRGRRERLARQRDVADRRHKARRNDLLPQLTVYQHPIAELRPPRHRTRKDDPDHIDRLAISIREYGFSLPVLVRDGHVLDGWSRVLAAMQLGIDLVPVIECAHLDDAQARALAIAVNRIGERGEWDLDELKLEFTELIDLEIDLDATGFSIEEQDIILLDEECEEEGSEEIEEPPIDPATRPGDIWQLAGHRIICGNALEIEVYEALLGDERVNAVLTDPPYNVKIKGNVSGLGKKVHDEFAMASGEMTGEKFQEFLRQTLALIVSFLVAGGVVFAFMDWRSIHRLHGAGDAAGLKLINVVVWYKQAGAMGSLYRSAYELIAVFCHGEKPKVNNVELGRHGRDRSNVWVAPGANRRGSSANEMLEHHATPKPVELCEDAVLDVTRRGDIVLDVFLGSGATLIAAEKTGRKCRGIELEPGFVDVCVRRWEKLTGKDAVLAGTGESFAEVAARRASSAQETDKPADDMGESSDEQ